MRQVVRTRWGWLVARFAGALAVLVVGAIHLDQWSGPYRSIPTIGHLFVINAATAALIGLALLAPIEHVAGRWAGVAVGLAMAGGIAHATTSFVMLTISEHRPLFGFEEPGYDPAAITATRRAEVTAVIALGTSLAARFLPTSPQRRW